MAVGGHRRPSREGSLLTVAPMSAVCPSQRLLDSPRLSLASGSGEISLAFPSPPGPSSLCIHFNILPSFPSRMRHVSFQALSITVSKTPPQFFYPQALGSHLPSQVIYLSISFEQIIRSLQKKCGKKTYLGIKGNTVLFCLPSVLRLTLEIKMDAANPHVFEASFLRQFSLK